MIILLLLLGSIVCALAMVTLAFQIGGTINPKTKNDKVNAYHLVGMALSIVAIYIPARFIIMNYQQVLEYPELMRYTVFGLIGVALIFPTGFLLAVIIDTVVSLLRKTRYT